MVLTTALGATLSDHPVMGKGSVDRFCSKQGHDTQKGRKKTKLAIKACKKAAVKKTKLAWWLKIKR